MSGRFTKYADGAIVAGFRFVGIWFIVCVAPVILYSLVLLVLAFVGPAAERVSTVLEALGWFVGSVLVVFLGVRFMYVTAQELRNVQAQLVKRSDQLQAWIHRERKDV
jgi:hypothetical protein